MIKCDKCGSSTIEIKFDTRGLPEAYCSDCHSRIKKMSTGEVIEFYEGKLASVEPIKETDAPMCKYCAEYFFVRRGRLGTVYAPIDAVYCPMCGRKLKPEDRKY